MDGLGLRRTLRRGFRGWEAGVGEIGRGINDR
jgi:hypothetical protein